MVVASSEAKINPYVVKAIDQWNQVCHRWSPFLWSDVLFMEENTDIYTFDVEVYQVASLKPYTDKPAARAVTIPLVRKKDNIILGVKIYVASTAETDALAQIIIHELGHALGLHHNTQDVNSIMQPKIALSDLNQLELTPGDLSQIENRYNVKCDTH